MNVRVVDFKAVFWRKVWHIRTVQSADRGLHMLRDGFGECSCIAFDDKRLFIVEEVRLVAVDATNFLVREVRELFGRGDFGGN